jgi:hypothetical protein
MVRLVRLAFASYPHVIPQNHRKIPSGMSGQLSGLQNLLDTHVFAIQRPDVDLLSKAGAVPLGNHHTTSA